MRVLRMFHCLTLVSSFLLALAAWFLFGCLCLVFLCLVFVLFVFVCFLLCFASAWRVFCPFLREVLDDRQYFAARSTRRQKK